MTRLFAGIPLSQNIKSAIAEWSAEQARLPVRWLRPEDLHITLVPPWAEEDADAARRLLEGAKGLAAPFTLDFSVITYGPNPRSPRLIWASGETPAELLDLQRELNRVLRKEPEKRPFTLHTTLARFRPEDFHNFPVKEIYEPVDWEMEVRSFALFKSNLSPQGAEYEILEEFPL